MASRPYFQVTTTTASLITGLTDGNFYVFQNIGLEDVQYTTHATDPTGEDVSWFIARPHEHVRFNVEAGDPVWVRTQDGASTLALGDG